MTRKLVMHRCLVLAALTLPVLARAQSDPDRKTLRVTAENLSAGDSVHAAMAHRGLAAGSLIPGDEVRYRLRFTNTTQGPVKNILITNPIPAGLRFVPASAKADRDDVRVEYSIDTGRTFSAEPTIEVVEDGRPVRRPAPPELFTDVRWAVSGWVQPGREVIAEYRARYTRNDTTQRQSAR